MSVQDLIMKGANAGTLPTQLALIAQYLQTQNTLMTRLAEALTTVTPTQPDAYAAHVPIVPTWQTTEQIIATGLLVSADTTDFYNLKIGEFDPISLGFGLTSMVPQFINLTGANRIPISRGLRVTVAQATAGGTAVIKATLFYLSGQDLGRKSH